MGMQVVLIGNLVSGFVCVGPFRTWDEAHEWCDEDEHSYLNTTVLPLGAQADFLEDRD